MRAARRVQDRFVEPLARFRRHAGVAKLASAREHAQLAVGLVDQQRHLRGKRRHRACQRVGATDRLLDEDRARGQPLEGRGLVHAPPQRGNALDIVVLLVAIERGLVRRTRSIEHRRDAREPIEILIELAADFQLEVTMTIALDHLFERLGQTVVARGLHVARGDRIDHADGMARIENGGRVQCAEPTREIEALQIRREVASFDAGQIAANRIEERHAQQPARGIEHRAIDERRPEARHQRIESARGARFDVRAIVRGVVAECGTRIAVAGVGRGGDRRGIAKLLEVVFVGQREVLVEPLRREQLGGHAPAFASVVQAHAHPHERLRRSGERDDAEAERQPQLHVALVQLDVEDFKRRRRRWRGRSHGSFVSAGQSIASTPRALKMSRMRPA